jgi:hypothetical protein
MKMDKKAPSAKLPKRAKRLKDIGSIAVNGDVDGGKQEIENKNRTKNPDQMIGGRKDGKEGKDYPGKAKQGSNPAFALSQAVAVMTINQRGMYELECPWAVNDGHKTDGAQTDALPAQNNRQESPAKGQEYFLGDVHEKQKHQLESWMCIPRPAVFPHPRPPFHHQEKSPSSISLKTRHKWPIEDNFYCAGCIFYCVCCIFFF